MTNTAKIIVAILGVALVAWGVFYAYQKRSGQTVPQTQPALNPISGQVVADKIPSTNPFETKVNPYDAYKNPFSK